MSDEPLSGVDDPLSAARARGRAFKAKLLADYPWLTLSETAERLGCPQDQVNVALASKQLLGVHVDGRLLIPEALLYGDQILPHLNAVLEATQLDSHWLLISWLLSPNDRLHGQSPAEALPEDLDTVLMIARGLGMQGGA